MVRYFLAVALAGFLLCEVGDARADLINTYAFSAAVNSPAGSFVMGQFSIDFTTSQITTFLFDTPFGPMDSSGPGWLTGINLLTPAFSPPVNFVELSFFGGLGSPFIVRPSLDLYFQADLDPSSFPGTFQTDVVRVTPSAVAISILFCSGPFCSFATRFLDGSAVLVSSTAPEPTTIALLALGSVCLALSRRKRMT